MKLFCDPECVPGVDRWKGYFEVTEYPPEAAPTGLYLRFHDDRLHLCKGADDRGVKVGVSDIRRRLQGTFALAKACGARQGRSLAILDCTAGLGVDGAALALLGNRLSLVERNRVLWAMLDDLLQQPGMPAAKLICADSRVILEEGAGSSVRSFDVVYLDPMFPARGKSALPGKRMQYLDTLLTAGTHSANIQGDELSLEHMIELARQTVTSRVVLKRRLKDPMIEQPDWQIKGRTVRYDVYRAGPEGES